MSHNRWPWIIPIFMADQNLILQIFELCLGQIPWIFYNLSITLTSLPWIVLSDFPTVFMLAISRNVLNPLQYQCSKRSLCRTISAATLTDSPSKIMLLLNDFMVERPRLVAVDSHRGVFNYWGTYLMERPRLVAVDSHRGEFNYWGIFRKFKILSQIIINFMITPWMHPLITNSPLLALDSGSIKSDFLESSLNNRIHPFSGLVLLCKRSTFHYWFFAF